MGDINLDFLVQKKQTKTNNKWNIKKLKLFSALQCHLTETRSTQNNIEYMEIELSQNYSWNFKKNLKNI